LKGPIVEHVETVQAQLQEIGKEKPVETPMVEPGERREASCSGGRVEFKLSDGRVVCVQRDLARVLRVFAVRGWLASQQSKLTNIDMATASYTVSFGQNNMAIVSLLVRNNLQNPLNVLGYNITLSNGTVLSQTSTGVSTNPTIPAANYQVSAKSDATFTITFSVTPGVAIKDVKVLVQDALSGQQQWITAIGGG